MKMTQFKDGGIEILAHTVVCVFSDSWNAAGGELL
jgi:hypothetical protein